MTDSIRKLLDQYNMPGRIARESLVAAGEIIDDLLNKYDSADGGLSMEYLRQVRDEVESCLQGAGQVAQAAFLVPVGLWGLGHGLTAPDLDISFGAYTVATAGLAFLLSAPFLLLVFGTSGGFIWYKTSRNLADQAAKIAFLAGRTQLGPKGAEQDTAL